MSILTRYILREMIGPTFLGFLFYTSIILMQKLFDMASIIIKRSLSAGAVGELLLYSLPNIVVLTVPMSLLFGILIAVGRLSSDSEIVAMRALGIPMRTIYRAVFMISALMFLLNLYLMNYVLPQGNRRVVALQNELFTAGAEKAIKPRVFHDDYANLMIYVNDIDQATGRWQGVFVADTRADDVLLTPQQVADESAAPQEPEDVAALSPSGAGQRTIVARTGNLSIIPSASGGSEVWMNLENAETHVWDQRRPDRYDLTRNETQRLRLPTGSGAISLSTSREFRAMDLRELLREEQRLRDQPSEREKRNIARVEIHKKFAIPFACIAFGVLGLPLGITNRRGGKSSGFSLSIAIIVFYYVLISNGEDLATVGRIPAWLGMWAPNAILLAIGIYLLQRANRDVMSESAEGGFVKRGIRAITSRFSRLKSSSSRTDTGEDRSLLSRLDITFPNTVDRYILKEFLKVLGLVLLSVVAIFLVIDYTDTAEDARESGVAVSVVLAYYRFQIFAILNYTLAISVLVATLVTFAILSKNNEVTALKASGVSLYRAAVPTMVVAAVMSVLSYFILDFVLPYANQRSAELKAEIKGRDSVSSSAQQRLWYHGRGRYLINFLSYDRSEQRLRQVQVFEMHPTQYRLTRRVYAERATWNGEGWAFEDGWMRSFLDDGSSTFSRITDPITLAYSETPEDFATEVRAPEQMNYAQLRRYVALLERSGYAADEQAVRLWEKTAWPVVSFVMALIALPFAFRMGRRGALYGIGLALILGIIYWMVFAVFTKFGEVGNLPPLLSAWAANILFGIAAVYMFLHVET